MFRQLTNRFSEIVNLKVAVTFLDFGNFKYCPGIFPATAYEALLKSYGLEFDSHLRNTQLHMTRSLSFRLQL